jgi:hypothetical protein
VQATRARCKSYVAGEIDLDGALTLVEETRKHLAALKAELPAGTSLRAFRSEWRTRMGSAAAGRPMSEEGSPTPKAYLQLAMLNVYVDRHFRLDREKSMWAKN